MDLRIQGGPQVAPSKLSPRKNISSLRNTETSPEVVIIQQQATSLDSRLSAIWLVLTKIYDQEQNTVKPPLATISAPLSLHRIAAITNRVATKPGKDGVPLRSGHDGNFSRCQRSPGSILRRDFAQLLLRQGHRTKYPNRSEPRPPTLSPPRLLQLHHPAPLRQPTPASRNQTAPEMKNGKSSGQAGSPAASRSGFPATKTSAYASTVSYRQGTSGAPNVSPGATRQGLAPQPSVSNRKNSLK